MKQRLIAIMLVFVAVLALLPGFPVQAQGGGDSIDAALDSALDILSEQLALPVTRSTISRWTWEEAYWPDSAMGCPQTGESYAQGQTHGYSITLTYQGAAYEVHVNAADSTAVLCGSQAAPPPTPNPDEPTRVPTDDPDMLVDAAITYLNAQLGTPPERDAFSRWTWQQATWPDSSLGCPYPGLAVDDSTPVRGFALMLIQEGTTYSLHITPDAKTIIPCDNTSLLPLVNGIIPSLDQPEVTPVPPLPVASVGLRIAYTGADGDSALTALGGYPGQPITSGTDDLAPTPAPLPQYNHAYSSYRWSADGQYLAFIDNARPPRLLLTDSTGQPPLILQESLAAYYPPAWNSEGTEIAVVHPTETFRGSAQVMAVYAVPALNTAEPRLLANFEQLTGCTGNGSTDPADTLYQSETGPNGSAFVLVWPSADSLLLTPSCDGSGLSQLDLTTGEATPLAPDLTHIALSPDGQRAAGLLPADDTPPQIVLLDLTSGERQMLTAGGTPDQILWRQDGRGLLISTVDLLETRPRSNGQGTITRYTVRLWSYDLRTEATLLLFEGVGRGIGRIEEAPDDAGILFSFVEDASAWQEAIASGADMEAQRAAAPMTRLVFISPAGEVFWLGPGGQPAFQPMLPDAAG